MTEINPDVLSGEMADPFKESDGDLKIAIELIAQRAAQKEVREKMSDILADMMKRTKETVLEHLEQTHTMKLDAMAAMARVCMVDDQIEDLPTHRLFEVLLDAIIAGKIPNVIFSNGEETCDD